MNYSGSIQRIMNELDVSAKEQMGIDAIVVEAGALLKLPAFLERKGLHNVQLVVDVNTYAAAGKLLEDIIGRSRIKCNTTFIQANAVDDVIADEASVVQLLLDIQQFKPQAAIAVGGGTLHDITRYAAFTTGVPFLSVPTAPSVDGFNSKGAPIIVRGHKKTIISIGPDAIFADLDLLTKAPKLMVAAGFGDMLGKYTSLFDWKFGAIADNEPYSERSEQITRDALSRCVRQAELIAKRDEEGIAILMSALIESGIAMLMFGKSHPASGSEHHLSHYWEMEYIAQGRKQLLHGAKVGVACTQIAKLYHRLSQEGFVTGGNAIVRDSVSSRWEQISQEIEHIPQEAELKELLAIVGASVTIEQLGVSEELLDRSMKEAHHIRPERYTLLRARNESLL